MLQIQSGKSDRFCDGVSRRSFLTIGAMGLGSLTLPRLLQAESEQGVGSSTKAIINIHLSGGPSHQDMFDLKPNAPTEYRGEFNPIATNVPGLEICEHFPELATMADQFAVIRSLVGMINSHSNFHTLTGYDQKSLQNVGGRPSIGSVVHKLFGPSGSGAPPYISYNGGSPGFLGPVYKPYTPSGNSLRMQRGLTPERLSDRTGLLTSLDNIRRDADNSGQMEAFDDYTRRAVDVVTSGRVADALDLNKEDPKIVEKYGRDGRNFLTARRLVEAGVRVVTYNWGSWDTHGQNFVKLRTQLPKLDQAMATLLQDLRDRGLDKDVTVVMWGEFGRTPRVNKGAGRDHWPRLAMCFLAGGGMRLGQAIGTSSRYAEEAKDRPVHLHEVFATLYHNMGLDIARPLLVDPNGRPQYLVDHREPIAELI
ncbi:MAG: DUF1501 domain-containing protein [Planctomycetales bacterium]|nr:DUF1501 domain-containing protein [Planctomycetales bacterium]